jgi:membrane protease YdiL (CAAX protease family)
MAVAGAVLATLLALALVLVQPIAGRRRYQRLLARLPGDPGARVRHYRRGIAGEWIAVAVVLLVGALAGRSPASGGLTARGLGGAEQELIEVGLVLAATAVAFRWGGGALREVLRQQARGFLALLPTNGEERVTFAALAVTAGICEEVLFRGFGIAYVRWVWPGATHAVLIVITSTVFGFAHLYQGVRGVVLTGIVGALLASVTLSTGTLVPAMVMHALLDLRVLALPDLSEEARRARAAAGGSGEARR